MLLAVAVFALLICAVWSGYFYWGVIIPFLEERGARDRSLLENIATHRNWTRYLEILEKERGRDRARPMKIQAVVLTVVAYLGFVVVLYHVIRK